MRTDIFFTRTTKPICNFVNPAISQGCIMVLSIVMLQNLWNPRLIGNLDIFPLIYPSDIVSINKLTLLLIINGQTHYVFTDKNNNVSLKVSTCIITSMTARPLVLMYVKIFKFAIILCLQYIHRNFSILPQGLVKGPFPNEKYSKIMQNSQKFHSYPPYLDSQMANLSIKNFPK